MLHTGTQRGKFRFQGRSRKFRLELRSPNKWAMRKKYDISCSRFDAYRILSSAAAFQPHPGKIGIYVHVDGTIFRRAKNKSLVRSADKITDNPLYSFGVMSFRSVGACILHIAHECMAN